MTYSLSFPFSLFPFPLNTVGCHALQALWLKSKSGPPGRVSCPPLDFGPPAMHYSFPRNLFNNYEKAICKENKWPYKEGDTAKVLIQHCFDNELIPTSLESHFNSLRSLLESGVPTIRNKMSAHGQGPEKVVTPDYLASYAINITGANILMLIKANESKK